MLILIQRRIAVYAFSGNKSVPKHVCYADLSSEKIGRSAFFWNKISEKQVLSGAENRSEKNMQLTGAGNNSEKENVLHWRWFKFRKEVNYSAEINSE